MECDALCFKAKNVYNSTLYYFRQNYFKGETVSYLDSYHHIKHTEAYKSLPTKISVQAIRQVENAKTSFFRAKRDYAKNPHKYLSEPRLPKYKNPEKGRQVATYTKEAITKTIWKKEQLIALSGTSIKIKPWKATYDNVRCARIIPKNNYFVIEIVYEIFLREIVREKEGITAAIDLGIDNLATLAFGAKDIHPLIFNGKSAKSVNQYYNKKKAFLQQCLEKDQY